MPSNPSKSRPIGLDSLLQPIETFTPRHARDEEFKISMLDLAAQLRELWDEEDEETLEIDVLWTLLYAFPALNVSGPEPEEMVEWVVEGESPWLANPEDLDALHTLRQVRRVLQGFEPRGFAAALWREVLLSIFRTIELFTILGDERIAGRCFELLDTAEAMADRFTGKA